MDALTQKMSRLADRRYRQNEHLDLFDETNSARFAEVEDAWIEACHSHSGSLLRGLLDRDRLTWWAGLLAHRMEMSIAASNQFVQLDDRERRLLLAGYCRLLHGVRGVLAVTRGTEDLREGVVPLLEGHFLALRRLLSSLRDSDILRLRSSVPCIEYSPELQLRVLGIDPPSLVEPVLDLGCGRQGLLVEYLRDLGIEAVGVDRFAVPSDHMVAANWLGLPPGSAKWGTIISHMSFSNHFIHHHLRRGGRYREYARAFMQLLHSLERGGSFLYAPGLPFVEPLVPAGVFEVRLRPVARETPGGTGAFPCPVPAPEGDWLYSSRITRL